jgi:hypothetical protein
MLFWMCVCVFELIFFFFPPWSTSLLTANGRCVMLLHKTSRKHDPKRISTCFSSFFFFFFFYFKKNEKGSSLSKDVFLLWLCVFFWFWFRGKKKGEKKMCCLFRNRSFSFPGVGQHRSLFWFFVRDAFFVFLKAPGSSTLPGCHVSFYGLFANVD